MRRVARRIFRRRDNPCPRKTNENKGDLARFTIESGPRRESGHAARFDAARRAR